MRIALRSRAAHRARWLLFAAPLLVACVVELPLPSAPVAATGPELQEIKPDRAWTGERVLLRGAGFGTLREQVTVRFGASGPVVPALLAPDGSSMEVVVPADATTGPVSVTAPSGTAVGGPFNYAGLGRLRDGRVAATHDLRARVKTGFPGESRLFALDREFWDQAAVQHHPPSSLGVRWVEDMVPFPGGRAAVLDSHEDDLPGTSTCGGHFSVFSDFDARLLKVPLWQDDPLCHYFTAVAVSPDGESAAVANAKAVRVLDLREGPPESHDLEISFGEARITPAGPGRFIVAGDEGVHLVHEVGGTWVVTPEVALLPDDDVRDVASNGTTLAALLYSGRIVVADVADWPPVTSVVLAGLQGDVSDASIALSSSGHTVLLGVPRTGRVVAFSLVTSPPAAVGSVALEDPARLVAAGDGLVYVGVRGGVAVLSQDTGNLIEQLPFEARLTGPVVRRAMVRDSNGNERERTLLEVASTSFGRVMRFDASDSAPLARPLLRLPPGGGVFRIAGQPTHDELFAMRGAYVLRRIDGEVVPQESAQAGRLADERNFGNHLALSMDGKVLYAHLQTEDDDDAVALLDVGVEWSAPAVEVSTGHELFGAFADDLDRLALVGEHGVRVLGLTSALTGQPRTVADLDLGLTLFKRMSAGASGLLFVGGHLPVDAEGRADTHLAIVHLADGHHVRTPALPFTDLAREFVVSPSGRHLWFLDNSLGQATLHGVGVDPVTGAFGAIDTPIPLLPGTFSLFPMPDGEHVVALDTAADRLQWLE